MTNSSTKKSWLSQHWRQILIPLILIIGWLSVAGIGGPYFGRISEVSKDDLSVYLPPKAESAEANVVAAKFVDNNTIPLIIVYSHNGQSLTPSVLNQLTVAGQQVLKVPGIIKGDPKPILSADKQAAIAVFSVNLSGDLKTVFDQLHTTLDNAHLPVDYSLAGPASFSNDLSKAFGGIDGILLLVALGVVFLILLFVYRSPFLPILVLLNSMTALAASILVIWHLAQHNVVQLNGQVQGILFILVIGAATDYSLLYIARYREELHEFKSSWQASWAALKAASEPIIAAGSTVAAGLLLLFLSDLGSNRSLAPVGAIGIGMAIICTLTFLPALLVGLGRHVFWPRRPAYAPDVKHDYAARHPFWQRIGGLVKRRPRRTWIITLAILLVAIGGVFQLKANGTPRSDMIMGKSEANAGQKIIDAHFPSGSGSPVEVFGKATNAPALAKTLLADKGINSLSAAPAVKDGTVMLQATLKDQPDSQAAKDTIVRLRQELHAVDPGSLVGGVTAIQYDTNVAATHDRQVLIPVILVAITIILMLLLRSLVAPLILLATTVASFTATLGVSALMFNHVWHFSGSDPAVILYSFVFLVALGIDYNIFLMTRVKEETKNHGVAEGTIKGLVVTGGVITSAGIVLASTFAALAVIPISFLVQVAFIVSFGVLLDTIIVRSLLVPALTLEIGRPMWWPSKLYRGKK